MKHNDKLTEAVPSGHYESSYSRPKERYEIWRTKLSSYSLLEAPSIPNVSVKLYLCGNALVTEGQYDNETWERSQGNIRTDHIDHYHLLYRTGTSDAHVSSGGEWTKMTQGDLVLADLAKPYRLHLDDDGSSSNSGGAASLTFPRSAIEQMLPGPMSLAGVRPSGPCSLLLRSHLDMLLKCLPDMSLHEAIGATIAAKHLLAGSIAYSPDTIDQIRPTLETALRRNICEWINAHLRHPDLGVSAICKAFHISRATLYRLFEPLDGVSRYILRRRLERVREIILAQKTRIHLGNLAADFGFDNASNFSRAFRRQFGYAPSDAQSARTAIAVNSAAERSDLLLYNWLSDLY